LGDPNDLENSEDCRSAGGHGNQHVRLRSAQIAYLDAICPAPEAISLLGAVADVRSGYLPFGLQGGGVNLTRYRFEFDPEFLPAKPVSP
jgi:hypothetical protein